MIRDLNLWRAAQLLVKRHGDDAAIVTAQRVDELAEGDLEGAAVQRKTPGQRHTVARGGLFAEL